MNCEIKSKYSNKESHNNISKDVQQGLKLNTVFFINPNTKCNKVLWNVKYNLQGKKPCPVAIGRTMWCPFPGISPGAEGNTHGHTLLEISLSKVNTGYPVSPFSIHKAANKRELNYLYCISSERDAWSGSIESGCLAVRGPSCPCLGSQADGSTAQRLSSPIWTLQRLS